MPAPPPPLSGQAGKGRALENPLWGRLSEWMWDTLGSVCTWRGRGQIWGLGEGVDCLGS